MNYASIKNCDIANGDGVRISLFVSGCRHKCKNCFNFEAWDFNYGNPFTDKQMKEIEDLLQPDYIDGISFLGGEPLEPENQEGVASVIKMIKDKCPNKSIWCYSGFTWEYLNDVMLPKCPHLNYILSNVDVLVDGPFVEDLKNPDLAFRGSANQRIIDCKESFKDKKIKELIYK